MVQAVTNQQAGVWVRTSVDQAVRIRYTDPLGNTLTTDPVTTSLLASDDTASFLLTGLASNTRYTYQVGTTDPDSGIESWTGNYAFQTVGGVVKSRQEAIRALDAVAEFFKRTEPSSPIPLFLARAKRLVSKDFLEVLADIAPEAVAQARAAGGLRQTEQGE